MNSDLNRARATVAHTPSQPSGFWERARQDWRNPDWVSAVIQLLGTLFFNVMTLRALVLSLGHPTISDRGVWHPERRGKQLGTFLGAVAFLVAASLSWPTRRADGNTALS